MILVLQRVTSASVSVAGEKVGSIGNGLLVLGCVEPDDDESSIHAAARKCVEMRVFEDENGRMNRDVLSIGGEILAVSQFTLGADLSRGRRPGFEGAARFEAAAPLFEAFLASIRAHGVRVQSGVFRSSMQVALVNDGPATFYWRTGKAG